MKKNYNKIINNIQKIRSKNNVNWMNILKLAFKLDANQAKKIMEKINYDDKKTKFFCKICLVHFKTSWSPHLNLKLPV